MSRPDKCPQNNTCYRYMVCKGKLRIDDYPDCFLTNLIDKPRQELSKRVKELEADNKRLQGLVDSGERIAKEVYDEYKAETDRLIEERDKLKTALEQISRLKEIVGPTIARNALGMKDTKEDITRNTQACDHQPGRYLQTTYCMRCGVELKEEP